MTKIHRWKAGLKEGNRSEADMTDGYFNSSYTIKKKDEQTPIELEWKVGISEAKHALVTSRKESEDFVRKQDVQDSVHSDYFYTDRVGGGLVYLDPEDSMKRHSLISLGTSNTNKMTVGSPNIGLDVILDRDKEFRFIEAISDPEWRDLVLGTDEDEVYDDWQFTFSSLRSEIFTGNRLLMEGSGVPYRLSYTSPSGKLWYENITQYEFDNVPESWVGNTIHPSGVTEVIYPDPFYLEEGEVIQVRIQTKVPTIRKGATIPGIGFLQATQAQTMLAYVTPVNVSLIAGASSIYCSEWASLHSHDVVPSTLHVKPWGILSLNDCTPLIFES